MDKYLLDSHRSDDGGRRPLTGHSCQARRPPLGWRKTKMTNWSCWSHRRGISSGWLIGWLQLSWIWPRQDQGRYHGWCRKRCWWPSPPSSPSFAMVGPSPPISALPLPPWIFKQRVEDFSGGWHQGSSGQQEAVVASGARIQGGQ